MDLLRFFKAKPVKAYWWKDVPNFGDLLTPLLLKRFADIETEWAGISKASVVSVGSILEHIPPYWDGYIVGTGRLLETSRLHLHTKTATILALRGPLSARGIPGSYALGDPGILANELIGPQENPQEKQWDLGIVPHWSDDELVDRFTRIVPKTATIKVISPTDDALTIIRQIGACRRIVTSSLHGMIVADSFGGIPRRVEICKKMWGDGGSFKFKDYSATINMPFEIGKMGEPKRFIVEEVQYVIFDALQALGNALKKR
jgi:hypothetical protein